MSGALSGKAAIITGGRRIGAAVALALAERGMNVALSFNRSRSEAERVATDIEATGPLAGDALLHRRQVGLVRDQRQVALLVVLQIGRKLLGQ